MFDFHTSPQRKDTGSLKWEKYADRDILPLWVADMDFLSPPAVLEALQRRLDHGVFGYTIPYAEVVDETLSYLKRVHQVEATPEELFWVPGLVPALNVCCRAFGNKGSSVMTCTPVYPPFLSAPPNSGRKRISVPLICENGIWNFDFDAMEAAVTEETRLFILCHPHNPVGRVWSEQELRKLIDFCERHQLVLISDEIHCDLILDATVSHVPTLGLGDSAADRTIALYAPSKTYNLPGLACAFAVIPNPDLRRSVQEAARGIITEVNAFGYAGCAAAYRDGEAWRLELIKTLRENRDLVYRTVCEQMPGVTMHPMQATYLAWLDVRELQLEKPLAFFEEAGVGLSNGADFGAPGWLRLNFGCPRDRLKEGLERMVKALN